MKKSKSPASTIRRTASTCPECGGKLVAEYRGTYVDSYALEESDTGARLNISRKRVERRLHSYDSGPVIRCSACGYIPEETGPVITPELKKPVEEYNRLMLAISREHATIGTASSKSTDRWNLRDMVSEMQHAIDEGWFVGTADKSRMKRFIKKYEKEVPLMFCTTMHGSKYDGTFKDGKKD